MASAAVIDAKVHYNPRRVARATPSGKKYLVGSGAYDMQMQKEFMVHAVDAAVQLIEEK